MPVTKAGFERLLAIDKLLRKKVFPSRKEIKEEVEKECGYTLSISTIRRDMDILKYEYKAPIDYSTHRNGYYYKESFTLAKIFFTEDDLHAMEFARDVIMQFRGYPVVEQFAQAFKKIDEAIRVKSLIGNELDRDIIQFEKPTTTYPNDNLLVLLPFVRERKGITFYYQKYNSKDTKENEVSPLLLKEYRNRWYLICYHNHLKCIKTYGIDRISDIKESENKFIHGHDFNPDEYFRYSMGITAYNDREPDEVVLVFNKVMEPYLSSMPLHETQEIKEKGARELEVKIKVYISTELISLILGYGSQVRVLLPKHLKEKIKVSLEEALGGY